MKMNKLFFSLPTLFMVSIQGFGFGSKSRPSLYRRRIPTSTRTTRTTTTTTWALIYGWDGCPPEEVSSSSSSSSSSSWSYNPYASLLGDDDPSSMECTPAGSAVAAALSYDPDRAGHLARLAVAFSPPERALTLDQLEQVNVICVRDNSVDIAAVICEDGTCLTLSVPIQFPRDCGGNSDLQSCVLSNLEDLNAQAATVLTKKQDNNNNNNNLWSSHTQQLPNDEPELELPSWWMVSRDPDMLADCQTIQELLNDEEFQPDVLALAQDVISEQIEHGYRVVHAKVTQVGPAGLCLHVRATVQGIRHVLDVAYPFTTPATTPDQLRAAVLGAIAAAEGS